MTDITSYFIDDFGKILSVDISNYATFKSDNNLEITNNATGFNDTLDGLSLGLDIAGNGIFLLKEPKNIIFSTNNTEKMRLNNNGALSLSASTDNHPLSLSKTTENNVFMEFKNSAATAGMEMGIESGGTGIIRCKDAKSLALHTSDTERMRIDYTGKVGIGKSPSELLDVNGSIKSNEIILNNSIIKLNGTNTADRYLKTNGSGVLGWSTDCSNIWSTNGNKIYYNTDSVGIGTSNPSCPLHIYSSTYKEPMLWCQSDGDCAIRVHGDGGESYLEVCNDYSIADTGQGWKVGLNDTTDIEIGYGTLGTGNNNISIYSKSSNNYVGIKNMSPSYELDVTGDINASGEVRNSGTILSSDKRIKKDILDADIDAIYKKFKNIKIKNYGYNKHYLKYSGKPNNKVSGLIAQELEDIFPDIVKTNDWLLRYKTADAIYDNSGNEISPPKFYEKNYTDFHTIDMNKLVIKMSATIISAQQKIDLLQASNEILNTDNKKNEERIKILENVLDTLIEQLLNKNLIEQE